MNKELKALYSIKYAHDEECGFDKSFDEECKVIETALKDYEKTDDELYDLLEKFGINNRKDLLNKLQALEIVINKPYELDWVIETIKSGCEYETYLYLVDCSDNKLLQKFKYTREEYEVLRKVLLKVSK